MKKNQTKIVLSLLAASAILYLVLKPKKTTSATSTASNTAARGVAAAGNKFCAKGWNEQVVQDKNGQSYWVCTKDNRVPIVELVK